MAIKFGRIDSTESSFEEQTFHKNQTLVSGSLGANHQIAIKDCKSEGYKTNTCNNDAGAILNNRGIHWSFVHSMFYMSGSSKVNVDEQDKFNSIYHNFNQHNDLKPFYTNKFYDSASIFYIPQATFGERVQPGSFTLTARTGSNTNSTKQIIIKDDKNGNLYSTNAYNSQSSDSHISSSDNYVGNILYDLGVAVLTETSSWSGSGTSKEIPYTSIGDTRLIEDVDYRYWTLNYNSTTPIFTSQYSIKIPAGSFNTTMNPSIKPYYGGDYIPSGSSIRDVANMRVELTTGSFSPFLTQIQLFRDNTGEEAVLVANLPRPVQMRDDIDIIVTFRVDH
tara:strand:- start:240 stop:1244 length:1005 start_codon:yes stop_codon:yes gene_type:complete